jgi:tetratricopeptide (TPR) repeat protein
MLQGLDAIPWANLEHAYGSAADVPALLRQFLDPDPKIRSETMRTLYSNVFHQGTRYPATPYVIPFLIEMCASAKVPNRGDLLRYWGSLITGYFSIQERPCWGDGKLIHWYGQAQKTPKDDPYAEALHQIYRESLRGHDLLCTLLSTDDVNIQTGGAWVLACLPTRARASVPKLRAQLRVQPSGWVRAGIAFALGELGAASPLRQMLTQDTFPAARCMAACELARIEPTEALIEPLVQFVSEPIEGYENVPGAGGKSTGDAAYSIAHLPIAVQRTAIPAICNRLDVARAFDTMPLVMALLSAAFTRRKTPLTKLSALQNQVLSRMVQTEELWSIGNLTWTFEAYGLARDRKHCAKLAGVKITNDRALAELRSALSYAEIGFLDEARKEFRKALKLDPAVLDRAPSPEEGWLLYAKAFAETHPKRALEAFRRAQAIKPGVANRVNATWRLADVLRENEEGQDS